MFVDKIRTKKPRSAHISPLCVSLLLLFGLEMLTHGDKYSLMCHILATISTLLVAIATGRVARLGTTPVPRTIILNTIPALCKLRGSLVR